MQLLAHSCRYITSLLHVFLTVNMSMKQVHALWPQSKHLRITNVVEDFFTHFLSVAQGEVHHIE